MKSYAIERSLILIHGVARRYWQMVAVILVALVITEQARSAHDPGHKYLQRFDVNGDGSIDKAEINKHRLGLFKAKDDDGNGSLSFDEFLSSNRLEGEVGQHYIEVFKIIDDDKNGLLSPDEFLRGDSFLFAEFDLNRDGIISRSEISAAFKALQPQFIRNKSTAGQAL